MYFCFVSCTHAYATMETHLCCVFCMQKYISILFILPSLYYNGNAILFLSVPTAKRNLGYVSSIQHNPDFVATKSQI